jgi:hypothetical protein
LPSSDHKFMWTSGTAISGKYQDFG